MKDLLPSWKLESFFNTVILSLECSMIVHQKLRPYNQILDVNTLLRLVMFCVQYQFPKTPLKKSLFQLISQITRILSYKLSLYCCHLLDLCSVTH